MDRRRLVAATAGLCLALMLITPTTAAPIVEAGTMQAGYGQPTAEENTLYIYGKASTTPCWSHFNNTDDESDAYGEETRGGNAVMDVKITCRMDPQLEGSVRLALGESILFDFKLQLNGQWTNGQETCNGDCENLNVSLMKGGREVAVREFDALTDGENDVRWDLPVTEDLELWDGSQESFAVEFRMVIRAQQGGWFSPDDEAQFGIWFAHPTNTPDYNATVIFPILNETARAEVEGTGGDGEGGDTPGFTTMIGVGGLAAAALLRPRPEEDA